MFEGFEAGDNVYVTINSDSGDMVGVMSYVDDAGVYMLVTHAMQVRGEVDAELVAELEIGHMKHLSGMNGVHLRIGLLLSGAFGDVLKSHREIVEKVAVARVDADVRKLEGSVVMKPLLKPVRTFLSAGVIDRIDALDDLNEHFVLDGLDFEAEVVSEDS